MELQKIKPRRAVCFRSKQLIIGLLEKYQSLKIKTSPTQCCKEHDVPVGTFYTWLKYQREGKYKPKADLSPYQLNSGNGNGNIKSNPVFASISSAELTVQLHEYVSPDYILSLLNKRQGS